MGSFSAAAKSNEKLSDLTTGTWHSWTRVETTTTQFKRLHNNTPAITLAIGKTPYQSLGSSTSNTPIKLGAARHTPTIPENISNTATSLSATFFTVESWRCSGHHEASNADALQLRRAISIQAARNQVT